jgi:uncharacterized protein (TIGR01777 family)
VRIVISGASGLLGSALVPALEADGHEVLRLVRRPPRGSGELEWDPAAGSLDATALRGVDAIVNVSGANVGRRWTASRKREILDSRVDTTRLLATTAAALEPRPSVYVGAGGVDVYGDRGDEIVTEESTVGRGEGFLESVGRAWEAAADPAREAGIRVVNFRQGIVLAKEGGALERMLTPFKLGVGGPVGSGRQWWSWVALDDATAAYARVLDGDLAGPVNLCAPNPVTSEQFAKALGRALRRPTILRAPAFAIRTVYGQMGEEALLLSHRVLPAKLLDAGFEFEHPDLNGALARALAD